MIFYILKCAFHSKTIKLTIPNFPFWKVADISNGTRLDESPNSCALLNQIFFSKGLMDIVLIYTVNVLDIRVVSRCWDIPRFGKDYYRIRKII